MRAHPEAQIGLASLRPLVLALWTLGAAGFAPPRASADDPDRLGRPGGPRIEGKLRFDPEAGFRFETAGEPGSPAQAQPVGPGGVVEFAPGPAAPAEIPPLFQVGLGESGRISGALGAVTEDSVTLAVPWRPEAVSIRRPGAQWVVQRLGEARILAEGFDALDASAWNVEGKPLVVVENGESALRLPAGGASIARRFDEPLEAGRVELTFRDDGAIRPDRRWTLELTFRAPGGPASLRVLLGWSEESLAVETPQGPSLAVQRLVRTDAWRRLTVRFGDDRTEVSVDGKDLAHGRGPAGPLESIRIATAGETDDDGPGGDVGAIQVARFARVPSSLEIDPTQDEARLVIGDQFFGAIRRGDRDRVSMLVDDRPIELDWGHLAGLYFRRAPAPGAPVAGALARVEWRAGGDDPDAPPDFAEGAVAALSDAALTLETPYAGSLAIPRDRLVRLLVLEPGLRLVLDPCSHHLGDEVSTTPPLLDPPSPEGGVLERPFEVPADAIDSGPAFAVLDVVGVVGEATGLPFSDYIRRGQLKTYLAINGRRVDYLNRHISGLNEAPERIRLPIPADALRPGANVLRIEQTGIEGNPDWYDDLGILGVAVEFSPAPARP
ncbi:hypothetical protein [Planctomyces sp. SH-PL62]|uniref:hypothetical protein n=1 Tax=Planctomyces sp. SH-PL62 TaxID=1636152 RepID=UPI00078D9355|nr:hypothetical protein [Planctomyces sp. SH-PL62]AMV38065.1 hypothetical protein VT85_11550 [Planctomyces sp. SH-PL62]